MKASPLLGYCATCGRDVDADFCDHCGAYVQAPLDPFADRVFVIIRSRSELSQRIAAAPKLQWPIQEPGVAQRLPRLPLPRERSAWELVRRRRDAIAAKKR